MKNIRPIITVCLLLTGSSLWAQDAVPREDHGKPKLDQEKETPPATAENKERAATFVRQHRNDLVFIKGKDGVGSGFIALMRGRKVLITNTHVMATLKNPSWHF